LILRLQLIIIFALIFNKINVTFCLLLCLEILVFTL